MFSADLGGYTAPPPFNKVALLLNGDGTNGAQNNTFVDSSTNNFTITRTGNVAQGTFSPFSLAEGQWSNYFDGSGDYLSLGSTASLAMGTNAYTIEFWVYSTQRSISCVFVASNSTGGLGVYVTSNGSVAVDRYGVGILITSTSGVVPLNAWTHIAVVRTSTATNDTRIYVNGVLIKTGTDSNNWIASTTPTIGGYTSGSSTYGFYGYLSNLRVVNGTAVYTSNFTPPTSPLTAISGTSLLTCQSNSFKDNSSNNFTITSNGDTKVTAFSPFAPSAAYSASTNGGSGYFDGSGDYLSTSSATALQFPTQDFTIECWAYLNVLPTSANAVALVQKGRPADNNLEYQFQVYNDGTNNYIRFQTSTNGTSGTVFLLNATSGYLSANQWYHLAVTRSGTTMKLWVNGVNVGTSTSYPSTAYSGTSIVTVAANNVGAAVPTGYLADVRIVKGTAVYTANFTPPTSPLTAVANTQLLLSCTNAGIIDNAGKNDIETVGNAQISTSIKKYGTGSMYFDGTGDWLLLADRPELQLGTGNFTVEGWVYLGATGAARGIVGKGTSTTGWLLSTNSSNQVVFTYGSSTLASSGTLAGSTWYHIAVCREGTGTNQTKIYINGSNDGTGTVNTNFNQTNLMYVGANRTGGDAMNGYIDDLRITQGQARYTANFTPPTQAFPDV